jgi:hypothetical protein
MFHKLAAFASLNNADVVLLKDALWGRWERKLLHAGLTRSTFGIDCSECSEGLWDERQYVDVYIGNTGNQRGTGLVARVYQDGSEETHEIT